MGEVIKKMKKGLKLVAIFLIASIALLPVASSIQTTKDRRPDNITTANMYCAIQGKKIIKELSIETTNEIYELAKSCDNAFYTIFNKKSTQNEVDDALTEVQPFFQALINAELTDKTTTELTDLYKNLRERVRAPLRKTSSNPRLTGQFNGVPSPVVGNFGCGMFAAGTEAVGWALGSNTVIPTIGVDLLVTGMFTGTSWTLGLIGYATQTLAQVMLAIGFAGILLGVIPSGIILGFIVMIGFAVAAVMSGPAPI